LSSATQFKIQSHRVQCRNKTVAFRAELQGAWHISNQIYTVNFNLALCTYTCCRERTMFGNLRVITLHVIHSDVICNLHTTPFKTQRTPQILLFAGTPRRPVSLPALAVCVPRVAWALVLVTPIGLRRRPDAQSQRPTSKDSEEGEGLRGSEQPALHLQNGAPELRQRQHESPSCLTGKSRESRNKLPCTTE